jgi:hypothetical protein
VCMTEAFQKHHPIQSFAFADVAGTTDRLAGKQDASALHALDS